MQNKHNKGMFIHFISKNEQQHCIETKKNKNELLNFEKMKNTITIVKRIFSTIFFSK